MEHWQTPAGQRLFASLIRRCERPRPGSVWFVRRFLPLSLLLYAVYNTGISKFSALCSTFAVPNNRQQALPVPSTTKPTQREECVWVSVTAGNGFLGGWIVKTLLERGYCVKACVRSPEDERKCGHLVRMQQEYNTLALKRLLLCKSDLMVEGSYDEVFRGCKAVFHVAEPYMSAIPGHDEYEKDRDWEKLQQDIFLGCKHVADSVEKSGTVTRLIYTSSQSSILAEGICDNHFEDWAGKHVALYDETSEINPAHGSCQNSPWSYGSTKLLSERLLKELADKSSTGYSLICANPSDIIGPVLTKRHVRETHLGYWADVLEGRPLEQYKKMPHFCVDVRDVAACQVLLAQSEKTMDNGERFLVASGDALPLTRWGTMIMELFPHYKPSTTIAPNPPDIDVVPEHTLWMRVHPRNDKVREFTSINFRRFDETLRDMIKSFLAIGEILPQM